MDDLNAILQDALARQKAGHLDAAASIYQKILDIQPDNSDALQYLGALELSRGDVERAIAFLARAVLVMPDYPDAHSNLSAAYLNAGRRSEALAHAKRAAALDPGLADAWANLGSASFAMGDTPGAVIALAAAAELEPDNATIWSNYLFALNFDDAASPKRIFDENRRWGRRLEARLGEVEMPAIQVADMASTKKLRLGYYLPEFNDHVTARFVEAILGEHDHNQFEVIGFGHRTDGKPVPDRLGRGFDAWYSTAGLGAEAVAQSMRDVNIQVLLHPCTFKARYREILAYRAAPVQVACINILSSTGLTAADYYLTDETLDPPGKTETFHTERLVRLPVFNTYQFPMAAPEVDPLPALRNGHITFGSFNNVYKLSATTIACWADILKAVPDSRFILKHRALDDPSVAAAVSTKFAAHGTDLSRLEFRGFDAATNDYLANYNDIDIALDPIPFGGGTTSYESIWMGVPVLTVTGDGNLMSRVSTSLMRGVGHEGFAVTSVEAYLAQAVHWAKHVEGLAKIRDRLRDQARATIFDAAGYTTRFEDLILDLWKNQNC